MRGHRRLALDATRAASGAVAGTATALAFLLPAVGGPSPNVWQLLLGWSCAIIVALAGGPLVASRAWGRLLAVLLLTALLLAWGGGQRWQLTAPAVLAILAIGLGAAGGAGLAQGGARAVRHWALGLLAAGLVSAVMGGLQYFGAADFLSPLVFRSDPGVAVGNLRQRNQLASLESAALIALLFLRVGNPPRRRQPAQLAAAVLVVGLAACTSRTGFMQLLLVLGGAVLMARRAVAGLPSVREGGALLLLYLLASLLLPVLAGHGLPGLFSRFGESVNGNSRLVLWHNVMELIAQRPWAGWGWGELKFAQYVSEFSGPRFNEILDNAHNLPLHLAVELGLPATVVLLGAWGFLLLSARPWHAREPVQIFGWALLAVLLLHSLLEYPLWYGPFQLLAGVALGMIFGGEASAARAEPVGSANTSLARGLGELGPELLAEGFDRRASESLPASSSASGLNHRATSARTMTAFKVVASLVLGLAVALAAGSYLRVSQAYLPGPERLASLREDTLTKLQGSWFYARELEFAQLALTPLTAANAREQLAWADRLLHFSPEPRVVARRIEALRLLGRAADADAEAQRFERAYPQAYRSWRAGRPFEAERS